MKIMTGKKEIESLLRRSDKEDKKKIKFVRAARRNAIMCRGSISRQHPLKFRNEIMLMDANDNKVISGWLEMSFSTR